MSTDSKISRRTWLKKAAIFTTAAGVLPVLSSASLAEAKVSKSVVHYQDHPKGMQMCGMCKFFIPAGGDHGGMGSGMMGESGMMMRPGMMGRGMMGAGTCELVAGRISPMGYCDLYAPRRG
jgi:hypothetical protein